VTLDVKKLQARRATVSLPFQPGKQKRVVIKVIDVRGNEATRTLSPKELEEPINDPALIRSWGSLTREILHESVSGGSGPLGLYRLGNPA
jgi:hypothetical protein